MNTCACIHDHASCARPGCHPEPVLPPRVADLFATRAHDLELALEALWRAFRHEVAPTPRQRAALVRAEASLLQIAREREQAARNG